MFLFYFCNVLFQGLEKESKKMQIQTKTNQEQKWIKNEEVFLTGNENLSVKQLQFFQPT